MKISYNWLKNYIETDLSPSEIAEKLTLSGLEVEGIETHGSDFENFVVGSVLQVIDHPYADKLKLCKVNIGEKNLQIVCGADNVEAGQKVPVATIGATLPAPMKDGSKMIIKKVKIRGENSEGMICSESELGISDDHSGIMVLNQKIESGTPLNKALNLKKDSIFEIGLTPNRPDASCHIGVARDLAAVLDITYRNPYDKKLNEPESIDHLIEINIREEDKCHRYAAKIVKNISVAESPGWLKNRLRSIGLRPINNVVDATNFILHEIGQPLHAFDYQKLEDQKIEVKSFQEEKVFETLDEVKRKVPAGTLFICDSRKPVAIAGVMGGLNSEVTDNTDTILIESAYFDPSTIRKASKNLGLQTDSSYRFERGIDPNLARKACERAAALIAELSGGTIVDGCSDEQPVKTAPLTVSLRINRLNQLLGTKLDISYVVKVLNALEIETRTRGTDDLDCIIPTFRPDLTREVDLIEEVGRIFDYNNIPKPDTAPFISPAPISSWENMHNRVQRIATRLMYKEISTNSLLSDKEESLFSEKETQIRTLNPVSQEATTLRTTLLGGFLKAIKYNLNRNARQLRFFETGHVYKRNIEGTWIDGIEEHSKLLLGLCGFKYTENWINEASHFTVFDLKSDLESLFQQLGILQFLKSESSDNDELHYLLENKPVARLLRISDNLTSAFDIDYPVYAAEIDLTVIYQNGYADMEHNFDQIPKFPPFEYDAAFIVSKQISAGELSEQIHRTAGDKLLNLEVFDVYEGENLGKDKKSIAFRFTFLDRNKTLTIKEVEPVVQKITRALESEFSAKLRS
jgi:phenylalanyl-tRNA synthetase beta chain